MTLRPPDKQGSVAAAWRAPDSDAPEHAAHIASYLVKGPFHTVWNWWMVSAVDLLDRPGVDPPKRQYPEAEYEILVMSVNPEYGDPDPDAPNTLYLLEPADLIFHTHGVSRGVIEEVLGLMVDQIIEGRSPDQDFRRDWESSLTTTIKHYKEGRHDPPSQGGEHA
jgi:hypothetical protein